MFKDEEDRLRTAQSKLTSAATTIRKQILNDSQVKKEFTKKEIETLEDAETLLLDFKNKVKHKKEKRIREKKAADSVEKNVKSINTSRVKRVVQSITVNSLFELSLLVHYYGQELGEEEEVRKWEVEKLKDAATSPDELMMIVQSARANVCDLLMRLLPNQEHRSGLNTDTDEWDYYWHKPESCSIEFIEELVRRHMREVPIKNPVNIEYVKEAVRLVNLARSVNQTIKDLSKSTE
ncbi:hypothetical protein ABRZ80_20620 [Vibrio vulnificus]|uniref:hypothetical protein n=1 Tax=Vibrio vulnificus TaxID=672 RepID=UPI0032EE09CD